MFGYTIDFYRVCVGRVLLPT